MRKLFIDEEESEPGENINILEGTPERFASVGQVFNFYYYPCLELADEVDEKKFDAEAIALAHLFAAAPDLLEACKALIYPFNECQAEDFHTDVSEALKAARVAIAKAEAAE